ncbi:MAG: substrate-binding domain-containing protein [Bacteroidales bacterium]|nr:substrate-binding domain-containing protein [Bacteroidales bacterium]
MNIFFIDDAAGVPKYRQLINSFYATLDAGRLNRGDRIPSLTEVCKAFSLSRDTVLLAYNELKSLGVIHAVPGKGYYVERTDLRPERNVFLLFDELNVFKEDIYTSFLEHLDKETRVDIFFHHFNYKVYKDHIINASGKYSDYILMPATFDNTSEITAFLPKERVYILDRLKPELSAYPCIYQDFKADVIDGLTAALPALKKYQKLIMVHPGGKEPEERVEGFTEFCKLNAFHHELIRNTDKCLIDKGEVYLVVSDRHLVYVVKKAAEVGLQLGKDIGLISFNDTVLKEIVANGITTISTDFKAMGRELAAMVMARKGRRVRNKSGLIERSTL